MSRHVISGSVITPTEPLDVQGPVTINAGEIHLGEVGGYHKTVPIEITGSAGSAGYSIGDVISGSPAQLTPYEIPNLFRGNGVPAFIKRLAVETNVSSQTEVIRVHLFNDPTAVVAADNAPYLDTYSTAEIAKRQGWIELPAMTTSTNTGGSDSRAFKDDILVPVEPLPTSRSLYVALETLTACSSAAAQKYTVKVTVVE
jgi:hypothetical protein